MTMQFVCGGISKMVSAAITKTATIPLFGVRLKLREC